MEWKAKNITIKCEGGSGYTHQFDVSKSGVFDLVKDVVHEAGALFKSSGYIHLGGRDVSEACWKKRTSISTFMKLKNIHTYAELLNFWRFELKQALSPGKKAIYWAKDAYEATLGKEDVVQYYGEQRYTSISKGCVS